MSGQRLTARQHEVLSFIEREIAAKGYPPTTRELAAACGLGAPSAAHRMLGALERKGYLTRTPGAKRAIVINPPRFDGGRLSTGEAELLATAIGWQDVAVERSLEAAQGATDPGVRTVLIRDALERHELTTQICDAVAANLRRTGPAVDELRWFRERVPWPFFVVDHLVYNRMVSVGGSDLETTVPDLARLMEAIRRQAETTSRQSEVWLADVLSGGSPEELARLRARAAFLVGMMVRTARHFGQEPFASVELPGALRPDAS